MKSIGVVVRRIDDLGRIVIPKGIRDRYDINEGDSMEILVDGNQIVLQKYQPGCDSCGYIGDITTIANVKLCRLCIAKAAMICGINDGDNNG